MRHTSVLIILLFGSLLAGPGWAQENQQWTQAEGPYGGNISSLAADPNTGNLWAYVSGSGVYVSENAGDTWLYKAELSSGRFIFRDDGAIFTRRFRSYDQGETWEPLGVPDSILASGLALEGKHILISSEQGIVYSADDGDHWTLGYPAPAGRVWGVGDGYRSGH
jgi:hypothetical protein